MQGPTSSEIGTRVRSLREAKGLSQQAVAARAQVALRTLVRIEQGEDTKVGTLSLVASALGVPVAELVAATPVKATA